jgi:hypothetical protein
MRTKSQQQTTRTMTFFNQATSLHTPLLEDAQYCLASSVHDHDGDDDVATRMYPHNTEQDQGDNNEDDSCTLDCDTNHDGHRDQQQQVSPPSLVLVLFGPDATFWMTLTFKLFLMFWAVFTQSNKAAMSPTTTTPRAAPIALLVAVGVALAVVNVWICQVIHLFPAADSNDSNSKTKIAKARLLVLLPEIIMMMVLIFVLLDKIAMALLIFFLGLLLHSILGVQALVRHVFWGTNNNRQITETSSSSSKLAMARQNGSPSISVMTV